VKRLLPVLAVSLALQLLVATFPDTRADLLAYRQWTRSLVAQGLVASYWPDPGSRAESSYEQPPVDYPPVFPYVLWLLGRALSAVDPASLARGGARLDFLLRAPLVLANGLIGATLFVALRRRAGAAMAAGVAALFLLSPAVIFDTAYWGQADSLCALFVVAGLALAARRPEWACAALAAGALVKPFGYAFLPFALVEAVKRHGWRRGATALLAATAAWGALLVPFAVVGRFRELLGALWGQIDAMPYASVNAHNLWWIVGRGVPWVPASQRILGPLTCEALGLLLFGAFALAALVGLHRSRDARALPIAGASVAFGLFVLATHMHENHLFLFLPLLLLARGEERRWRRFFLAVSAVALLNMVLHDPFLMSRIDVHAPGPRVELPPQLEPAPGLADYLRGQGYPEVAEEMAGHSSALRLVLTLVNSQACILLFAYWVRGGGLFQGSRGPETPGVGRLPAWGFAAIVLFLVATAVPFVAKLVRAAGAGG
jgi:Gpi18-like mannosyltransferase